MNLLNSSEITLRAAVFAARRQLVAGENFAEKVRTQAIGQLQIAQQAEGLFHGVKESGTLRTAAVNAAISGIQMASQAVSSELKEAKFKRQSFVAECETYLATFVIDTQKEFNEFTKEEKAVRLFFKMANQKCPEFIDYLGMSMHTNPETPHIQYYTVLPFYRMSQALEQNGVVASIIDHHRQTSYLFLKTGLPLQAYYETFKGHSKIWLQLLALIHSGNYLNHLRAPRFIITAIANLLWNLQHPVNTATGIPFTLTESVNICYKAGMFLNDLLNPHQFSFIHLLDDHHHYLEKTLSRTELLIKSLHRAFDHERLNEINLHDVSLYLHTSLRLMSNKILELIYHRENASEQLIGQILIIGELFLQYHRLYGYFEHDTSGKENFMPDHINKVPCTLIDVLTIFTHLTPGKRDAIFRRLKASGQEIEIQLAEQLKEFHKSFLQPFELTVIERLQLSKNTRRELYRKTGSRFVPLLLLVMESFTVFKDTRPKKPSEIDLSFGDIDSSIYDLTGTKHDREQRQAILKDAAENTPDTDEPIYNFSLSCFFSSNTTKAKKNAMNNLLQYQNEIRKHTLKIDFISSKIKENRAELLKVGFKEKVLSDLEEIISSLTDLNVDFSSVEKNMLLDSQLHRDQKRILQPMFDELEKIIESIQKSINMVKSIMSSKDFDEKERERIRDRTQFRTILSPSRDKDRDGASRRISKQNSYSIPEEPIQHEDIFDSDDDSINSEELIEPTPEKSFLYYLTLSQLGLVVIAFALNLNFHFIMLTIAMNICLLLLGIGLPVVYLIYEKMNSQFEEIKYKTMETIFN